jgi:hypothetical protein
VIFDPPEPQVWTDDRCHEVVRAVWWPQARLLPPRELQRLYATVRDVVDNMPIPSMSQRERETIMAAAEAVRRSFK